MQRCCPRVDISFCILIRSTIDTIASSGPLCSAAAFTMASTTTSSRLMGNCQYELVAVSYLLRNDSLTHIGPKRNVTEVLIMAVNYGTVGTLSVM